MEGKQQATEVPLEHCREMKQGCKDAECDGPGRTNPWSKPPHRATRNI